MTATSEIEKQVQNHFRTIALKEAILIEIDRRGLDKLQPHSDEWLEENQNRIDELYRVFRQL